jgi:hypothetical protein
LAQRVNTHDPGAGAVSVVIVWVIPGTYMQASKQAADLAQRINTHDSSDCVLPLTTCRKKQVKS